MLPKINDPFVWQQAELLMQPAFIRIIDNIRKQLEQSAWKGTYENLLIWPEGTTEETKTRVTLLVQQLEGACPEKAAEIEQAIAQLPTPHPGYYLALRHQEQEFSFDLWDLCYQVCFHHYIPSLTESPNYAAEIDTSLMDETGDIDWQRLDAKAAELVKQVFASLPDVK